MVAVLDWNGVLSMENPDQIDRDLTPADDAGGFQRREFLKASAAAVGATLLSSCMSGGDSDTTPLPGATEVDPLATFDHLVVLMMENRSFDNLLGYLYPAGFVGPNCKSFAGLLPPDSRWSNPVPASFGGRSLAPAMNMGASGVAPLMNYPDPNPGEGFKHTNVQLYSQPDVPATDPGSPTMTGFVQDYCDILKRDGLDVVQNYPIALQSYGLAQPDGPAFAMPVIATLAQSFAVYDHWFAAVPSETYTNRSYFHASTSASTTSKPGFGYVENDNPWNCNDGDTIFDRLSNAPPVNGKKLAWCVYSDFFPSLTLMIHFPRLVKYPANFRTMQQFRVDAAEGNLPDYAFIEPYMSGLPGPNPVPGQSPLPLEQQGPGPANSMHPNQNVLHGELLLTDVYNSVKGGKDAAKTLLLITFDEHGGCYDHVGPGKATPPAGEKQKPGEFGFMFDRLGVRVPAIAISAHTPANKVVNTSVNHAAVVRTLCAKHNLPTLTARDADVAGGDLSGAIDVSNSAYRDPSTWPTLSPRTPPAYTPDPDDTPIYPAGSDAKTDHHEWKDFVDLAYAYFQPGSPPLWPLNPTLGDARSLLQALEAKWRAGQLPVQATLA
jgi:phospholipase C